MKTPDTQAVIALTESMLIATAKTKAACVKAVKAEEKWAGAEYEVEYLDVVLTDEEPSSDMLVWASGKQGHLMIGDLAYRFAAKREA